MFDWNFSLPQRMRSYPLAGPILRDGRCLIALILFLCPLMWPQLTSASPAPKTEPLTDALGRTTPRGTVLNFLVAGRKGDNEAAGQYLNTRLRGQAAATLAHQLYVVLDRRLPPLLNQLSDRPEGSLSNPLKPNEDFVGTISSTNGNVDIILERVDRGKAGLLWLFSARTLQLIPDLYSETDVPVESLLPDFLNTRFAGIQLYEWLAVCVGMPFFYFIIGLVGRLLGVAVGPVLRWVLRKPALRNPQVLPPPVRFLLLAIVIRLLLSEISLPLLARQIWSGVAAVITTASIVWLLTLLNGGAEHYIRRHLHVENLAGATSMLRLARRVVDLLIIVAGVIQILSHFGVNPAAALAGLGIGGIAVALAAQKTLENVIGGVSLIFGQEVRVGQMVKVGDTTGTLVEIGLRSTLIRTLDRTMLSVPNGQIAAMSLENLSARDKFWFHQIFGLRYGTTCLQTRSVVEGIRTLLKESCQVEPRSFRVSLLRFGPSSMEVEVFAYVFADNSDHFLELQGELLLRIMESVESAGAQIALPSQTIFFAPVSPDGKRFGAELQSAAQGDKQIAERAELTTSA